MKQGNLKLLLGGLRRALIAIVGCLEDYLGMDRTWGK